MIRQIAAIAIGVLVAVVVIFAIFDVRGTGGLIEMTSQLTDIERDPPTLR